MRLYAYVVARDYGFAPNPFFNACTLATCKPAIRKGANVGDWVVGTGPVRYHLEDHLIYAMRVGAVMTFDEYWNDSRFRSKRPTLHGSVAQAFGDNIYHHVGGIWRQEDSHHSHRNGCLNHANLVNDTQADRVLVSNWFVYFGRNAVEIPEGLRGDKGRTLCRGGQGHFVHYSPGFEHEAISWILSLDKRGFQGEPVEFEKQLPETRLRHEVRE